MRFLKSGAKRLLTLLWRALPRPVRAFLFRQILEAESRGERSEALRRLFFFNDDLDQAIINASMTYGQGVHPKHRLMKYHQFFIDRARSARRILDVGCGRGVVSHEMVTALEGPQIVGVDGDEGNIRFARTHFAHPRLTFIHGWAPKDLPAEPFDVIVLSNVLEHIEHRPDFLRELQRRASFEKILIRLPLFDRDWVVPLRQELDIPYFSDSTHFAELTAEGWMAEIRSAGLHITHHECRWGEIWLEAAPDRAAHA